MWITPVTPCLLVFGWSHGACWINDYSCCPVCGLLASVMQCLERHGTPPPWCGWVCFLVPFVVSVVVSGKDPPGPFPNPVAKLTCADGTAPGRVWESKSPPALNLIVGGQCWPCSSQNKVMITTGTDHPLFACAKKMSSLHASVDEG